MFEMHRIIQFLCQSCAGGLNLLQRMSTISLFVCENVCLLAILGV